MLRAADARDGAGCAVLDATYATSHVWQLDTRQEADELRITFRQVRLPRELTLHAEHRPPSATSVRKGLLWLVAEEVEVRPGDVDGVVSPPPAWSHAMRRTGSTSAIQLSLPAQPAGGARFQQRHDGWVDDGGSDGGSDGGHPLFEEQGDIAPATVPTRIAGYVVVTAAPRDGTAYLSTLVVDKAQRRKGIASRLLGAALRWAAQQGASSLMADVPARNYPALRLLQKAGFTFCGFNDRCYSNNEVAVFFSTRLR